MLKVAGLRDAEASGRSVVVDRSVYEDRDVMARSWADTYWDSAARRTYRSVADAVIADVREPDVIISCACSPELCSSRRADRARPGEPDYDPAWVAALQRLYDDWLATFDLCPVLEVDTEVHDVRDPRIVADIVADIATFLAPPPPHQPALFGPQAEIQENLFERDSTSPLRVLRRMNDAAARTPGALVVASAHQLLDAPLEHPVVYVAAPFTAAAVEPEPLTDDLRLPMSGRQHGLIAGSYRRDLERICQAVERRGLRAFLPHRDLNRWGNRSLAPQDVADACVQLVRACDGFLGVLGQSFGAHVEVGVALALGKPTVLVEVDELNRTFLGHGLALRDQAVALRVTKLRDVPAALEASSVLDAFM